MPTHAVEIRTLAAEFIAARPPLNRSQQRLALAIVRTLAGGNPVAPQLLAERAQLPLENVAAELDRWPMLEREANGRVSAFAGLSLEPTSHVLEVGGRTLYAWCALDTLFLPELIGWPARIRSTCPQTRAAISLTVDSAGVHDVSPHTAVMSVRGASGFDPNDAISTFCCNVRFFTDTAAAHAWTERRHGTYVVSIDEGFEYGRLYNHSRFREALEADEL